MSEDRAAYTVEGQVPAAGRVVNKLSSRQGWQLRCWMEGNRVTASRLPADALAARAAAELGFVLTGPNAASARRDVGIEIDAVRVRASGRRQLAVVARALVYLYATVTPAVAVPAALLEVVAALGDDLGGGADGADLGSLAADAGEEGCHDGEPE